MTEQQRIVAGDHVAFDIAELERLAEWKISLAGKIERGRWCLNLLLLDGLDRDELDQLKEEVSAFKLACLEWRQPR